MLETQLIALPKLDAVAIIYAVGRGVWRRGSTDQYSTAGRRSNLLFYLMKGERSYSPDTGADFLLERDELIFIPITSCYSSTTVSEASSEGIYIDFGLFVGDEEVYISDAYRIFSHMNEYLPHLICMMEDRFNQLRLKAELYRLLDDLSAHAAASLHSRSETYSVYRAVLEIELHPERPLDIAAAARACCLSETGFREQFKRFTGGISPMEYRNRLRIDRADDLIASRSLGVGEIAERLGFYDSAHFYRVYKKIRGVSPGERHRR